MATKIETYEIVLAHIGRRDESTIETVTVKGTKEYRALTDRIFFMNDGMDSTMRAEKAYYGIRSAA